MGQRGFGRQKVNRMNVGFCETAFMSEASENVFQAAMALPVDERVALVEALIAECDQDLQRPFADAWIAEIQRRSAEIDAATATLTPWPEVKARIRKRVEERRRG
jgi:putative addiction module component (TIGR02574 family)